MSSWKAPTIGQRPVVVLGAGVLGRRIAVSWVASGYNVIIRDPSEDQRNAAIHFIDNEIPHFQKALSVVEGTKAGTYSATNDLAAAVKDTWFVIEAVPEKLDLKISTFGDLSKLAPKDAVLGSNSSSYKSSMMLERVDEDSKKRILNTHYGMPPLNRTVELMTDRFTDPAVLEFMVVVHNAVGLMPAVARKESTGFIFNRLWAAVKRESIKIIAEGVSDAGEIDRLWGEFFGSDHGGPCAIMDAVGLDTVAFIEDNYIKERHLDGTNTVDFLRKNYISQGRLGAKSGKGGLFPAGATTKSSQAQSGKHDNLAAPNIYILDLGMGEIEGKDYLHSGRVLVGSANGKATRTILDGLTAPDGIDVSVSANRIFWTNMGIPDKNDGTVMSAKLDGSDKRTVTKTGDVHTPKQLTIDETNKKLYYCDREGMRVHRSNFDGSDHEVLVQAGDFNKATDMEDQTKWCVGISVDPAHGKFYWTQKGFPKSGKGRIFRANIEMPAGKTFVNRTDIDLLFDHMPEPIDLDFDSEDETLYWTDRGEHPIGNTVNCASLKGWQKGASVKVVVLSRHLHEAIGLKVDKVNKQIYFADLGGIVYRIDIDGKNKKRIYDTDSTFTGIALSHVG